MIKIYHASEISFNSTEIADIEVLAASSKKKINGLYTLTFEAPIHYAEAIQKDRIIEADSQYYRIQRIQKSGKWRETLNIYCESLFQVDMLDAFAVSFIYSEKSAQEMLTQLVENTMFIVTSCDELGTNEIAATYKNKAELLNELLEIYQGELQIDGLSISIKGAIGENRGVQIKKGKNLKGIEATEDISNVITRLYYSNKTGNLGGTLDSQYINSYANPKCQYAELDAETKSQLDALALAYLKLNEVPKVNYKIDFADLYYTEEYFEVKELEKVELGDIITIIHDSFNINIQVRILEIERDITTRKNTRVVLGNYRDNFLDYQVALNTTKQIVDYAFKKRRLNAATLKGLRIINENTEQISMEVTEEGIVKIPGDAIVSGTLDANQVNIINFTADTGDIYYVIADNAKVTRLTVNELLTMMLEYEDDEVNFVHIHEEYAQWKTGVRKYYENGLPYPDIQLTDSENNRLYWVSSEHKAMTTKAIDSQGNPLEPVMIHQYDIHVKMEMKFEQKGVYKVPMIIMGTGTGVDKNGKAYIYKDENEYITEYFSTSDGSSRKISMNDSGICFTAQNGSVSGASESLAYVKNSIELNIASAPEEISLSIELGNDSHVYVSLIITGTVTAPDVLNVNLKAGSQSIYVAKYQVITGVNTISFSYPITQMQKGTQYISIELSLNTAIFTVQPEQLVLWLRADGLLSGVSPIYPKGDIVESISVKQSVNINSVTPFNMNVVELIVGLSDNVEVIII